MVKTAEEMKREGLKKKEERERMRLQQEQEEQQLSQGLSMNTDENEIDFGLNAFDGMSGMNDEYDGGFGFDKLFFNY